MRLTALWASVALFSLHRVIRVICPQGQPNRLHLSGRWSYRVFPADRAQVQQPSEPSRGIPQPPSARVREMGCASLPSVTAMKTTVRTPIPNCCGGLGRNPRVPVGRHRPVDETRRRPGISCLRRRRSPASARVVQAAYAACSRWAGTCWTRWKAMRMLAQKDLLNGFVGVQRPLRPHGTSAAPKEILNLVSTIFQMPADELTGPSAEQLHHSPEILRRYGHPPNHESFTGKHRGAARWQGPCDRDQRN